MFLGKGALYFTLYVAEATPPVLYRFGTGESGLVQVVARRSLFHSLSICEFGEGRQPQGLLGKLRSLFLVQADAVGPSGNGGNKG